jgi:DNA repair photolyase
VLEILNKHKIQYVILTRSPYILDYLSLLKRGFCKEIYFTVNNLSPEYKLQLEPKSPAFDSRREAVNKLLAEGLPVVPYFSPVLPWISVTKEVFSDFTQADAVEFECLNFRLNNIREIIDNIALVDASLKPRYERMLNDRWFYSQTWQEWEEEIEKQAKQAKKGYNVYVHGFGDYFQNHYA